MEEQWLYDVELQKVLQIRQNHQHQLSVPTRRRREQGCCAPTQNCSSNRISSAEMQKRPHYHISPQISCSSSSIHKRYPNSYSSKNSTQNRLPLSSPFSSLSSSLVSSQRILSFFSLHWLSHKYLTVSGYNHVHIVSLFILLISLLLPHPVYSTCLGSFNCTTTRKVILNNLLIIN